MKDQSKSNMTTINDGIKKSLSLSEGENKNKSPQIVIDDINKSKLEGWKVSFYVGEFDFLQADIKSFDDLPEDFMDEEKNIYVDTIRHGLDFEGKPFLCFSCVNTGEEYEIPFSEWEHRIGYTGKTINPGGKKPDMVEVFSALAGLANKHDIPLEFMPDGLTKRKRKV